MMVADGRAMRRSCMALEPTPELPPRTRMERGGASLVSLVERPEMWTFNPTAIVAAAAR
jgi:hypothetical protein